MLKNKLPPIKTNNVFAYFLAVWLFEVFGVGAKYILNDL